MSDVRAIPCTSWLVHPTQTYDITVVWTEQCSNIKHYLAPQLPITATWCTTKPDAWTTLRTDSIITWPILHRLYMTDLTTTIQFSSSSSFKSSQPFNNWTISSYKFNGRFLAGGSYLPWHSSSTGFGLAVQTLKQSVYSWLQSTLVDKRKI